MNLTVTGQNFEITDAIKKFKKKGKPKQAIDCLIMPTSIFLYVDKNRHMAEATVKQKGLTTRAKDETRDLYLTVDNVLGKVEKQLGRHKSRTKNLLTNKT